MLIRILNDDPPDPKALTLFVTTETEDEVTKLQAVIADLKNYVGMPKEKKDGRKTKKKKT